MPLNDIAIDAHKIGPRHPPFIVAEISANHNQSLKRALQLVDAAKAAGVHAVKLQTYTADTITLDIHEGDFLIQDPKSLWAGRSLYDLYQEAYTPWEWHQEIFQYCRKIGLTVFSTPFDATAVDFLEKLQAPCYKIASLEIVDHALIKKAASTGKPLIMSTGGATRSEIEEAVNVARGTGCKEIILLKCTSTYPATPKDSHLRTLPHLAEDFAVHVGLSDHTLGIGAAIASIPFGSCLIEKHLTLSRSDGGLDAAFSLEPDEFKALVIESKRAWEALGTVHYGPTESEETSLTLRRSLYFVKDLKAGEVITDSHIRSIRPGKGLPPKELPHLIGLRVSQAVKRGDAVRWELIQRKT